ncbi:GGDEF domain-containing protein [Thermatribacter velox]|uniref:diguanylate cyclase n=1 Tax=Thermatribacter velox TaxID=3039681 RepID=A0ABZ2YCB8_9BACT
MNQDNNQKSKYFSFVFWGTTFPALFLLARRNYLFFHTIIEFFAIFTGFSITLISLATRNFIQNRIFLKFGILYFFVTIIDFLHTLAYKGMGVFPGWTANHPTQFWIAGRLLETTGFFLIIFFAHLKEKTLSILLGLLCTLFIAFVWFGTFPNCFIEGHGLTIFKIAMEYAMVAILFIVLLKILKGREQSLSTLRNSLVLAVIFTMLGELSFTLYSDVYGFFNFLGHLFRFLSYLVILRGVIINSLNNPVQTLMIELDREREKLKQIAHYDSLTGLYSRNFFNELIQKQAAIALRKKVPISFIMVDVNRFKKINDTCGHLVGDQVLKLVGNCIAQSIRESDIAARYGGDEFIVILYGTGEEQAKEVATRIREKVKTSGKTEQKCDADVDISFGVAQLEPGESYLQAIHRADERMYLMKNSKKNTSPPSIFQ